MKAGAATRPFQCRHVLPRKQIHSLIWPLLAALGLSSLTGSEGHVVYKIGSDWVKKAPYLAKFLETNYLGRKEMPPFDFHWINGSEDLDLCELRKRGLVALLISNECKLTAELARKASQVSLPFFAVLNHGCSREQVLQEAYGNVSSHGGKEWANVDEEPPGVLLMPYFEASDVRIVLAKMVSMHVNQALVVYDHIFATFGMRMFTEEAKLLNLTLAFVPLEADQDHVKRVINATLHRLAKINSFFTSFVMLVFANFTTGEQLEAELIEEGVIDPNMRMLLFYNGWDKSIGRWYYQHVIRYPYEKLIYVITRAYINETRDIMKKISSYWGSQDYVFSFPDISTLVFLHYVIEYISSKADEMPAATGCGSPMDGFLEGMQQNVTSELKRLEIHSSTATYRTFFMAPVTPKEYRLKQMETWKRNGTTFDRRCWLNEVDAYLKNRTINLALLEYPPYSVYEKSPTGQLILTGTFLRLMDYLKDMYGFNVSYQLFENTTSVGMKHGDYNWSGLLGMLNTRDTDWVTFLDITEPRMGSFSMTNSLISHSVAILVQKPKILSRKMLFVQPFSTQVWILVLASIPVVSIALWLVYNWSPEEAARLRRGQGLSLLHNCVWYTYGALLQQGGVHLPVGTSSRLVVGTWWLYVVIVMAYYSSNLIAFLTVPEPQWLVSSFHEAVRREDVHLYIPFGTGLHQEIMKSSAEDFLRLRRRLKKKRTASTVQDIHPVVDKVANGKAVLMADKVFLDALVMADYRRQGYSRCRLAILQDNIMRVPVGIGTRKGSPFVQNLNHDFFELRSSGNLRFLLKNHREKPHACIRDYDAETRGLSKPIGLSELESAFLLLLLGTAASSLLVPVEFAARWARTRRRARKLRPPDATPQDDYGLSWPDDSKARPIISLRHGWKRADKAIWTTVGPGGHVISDCYPAFGQFGRRPLFVQESPPFPFYQPFWGGTGTAQESAENASDRQRSHVVTVGNWP